MEEVEEFEAKVSSSKGICHASNIMAAKALERLQDEELLTFIYNNNIGTDTDDAGSISTNNCMHIFVAWAFLRSHAQVKGQRKYRKCT